MLTDEKIIEIANRSEHNLGDYLQAVSFARAIENEILSHAATVAEPIYTDSTPQLHVGGSSFESWYADYAAKLTGNPKQTARDAYAAGMGDPLVVAREAAQQQAEPVGDEREPSSLERFLAYLTDHCIGQTVTEEAMEEWMADLLDATPCNELANPPKSKGLFASVQSGQRAGLAEGYVLVPKEPTPEMQEAASRVWDDGYAKRESIVYKAMLAAAPTQQQERSE